MTLKDFFIKNNKLGLGFSGGVDSSYLLYAGLKYGADIRPYYVKTAFQPQFELEDALKLSRHLNIDLKIINLDILKFEEIVKNPFNRCYHCKLAIFSKIKELSLSEGYNLLIDGNNASDSEEDRPGMQALREMNIVSPLRLSGLGKEEIRKLSKSAGLFTWNKPSYSCLATRIPTDERLSLEILNRVEKAENALFKFGFSDLRVRVFHNAACLQLPKKQMDMAVNNSQEILEQLSPYFDRIFLDFKGR